MQSWGDLIVLPLPTEVSCSGAVPTMTKESDVEAEGILYFNYLFGPFVVFPFSAQIQCQRNKRPCWHWPSDHQTHAAANLTVRTRVADDGPGPLCTLALTLKLCRLWKNKTDVFFLFIFLLRKPGPGKHRHSWPSKSNARTCLQGGTRPPVKWLTTFKEFLTSRWWASWRELLTSEMNSDLCLGGCWLLRWLAGLLTSLTNGNVCLGNFWPARLKERYRRCLRAKLIVYSGRASINIVLAPHDLSDNHIEISESCFSFIGWAGLANES